MMSVQTRRRQGPKEPLVTDKKGACGMTAIVSRSNTPTAAVIDHAYRGSKKMMQRGGGEAGGAGAGVTVEISPEYDLAGLTFLPGETPGIAAVFLEKGDKAARADVEEAVAAQGFRFVAWREVRTNDHCLGKHAKATKPDILHAVYAVPARPMWHAFFGALAFLFLAMFGLTRTRDWADPMGRRVLKLRKAIEQKFLLRRYGAKTLEEAAKNKRVSQYPFLVSCSTYLVTFLVLGSSKKIWEFYPELRTREHPRKSRYALVHVRYSTNTMPEWARCHPWDGVFLHNGEINTLRGNIRVWLSRAIAFCKPWMLPVLNLDRSDSGNLAEILSLLAAEGHGEDGAIRLLIPPAYEHDPKYQTEARRKVRALYDYWGTILEPWEGPLGGIIVTPNRCERSFWDMLFGRVKEFGPRISAIVDRSGLRPLVVEANDDLLGYSSEFGFAGIPLNKQTVRRQIQRGEMMSYDLVSNRIVLPDELEDELACRADYEKLLRVRALPAQAATPQSWWNRDTLVSRLNAGGYYADDCEAVLSEMALEGKELHIGMGDDTQPFYMRGMDVLTSIYRAFVHGFAHVTRPSLDSVRQSDVFGMKVVLGPKNTPFQTKKTSRLVELPSPFLSTADYDAVCRSLRSIVVRCDFDTSAAEGGLRARAFEIAKHAVLAVERGAQLLVLDDTPRGPGWQSATLALVVPLVHRALAERGLRSACSVICRSVEAREAHCVGTLLTYGAEAVHCALVEELLYTAPELLDPKPGNGKVWDWSDQGGQKRFDNWRNAATSALRLIMGRMGCSPMASVIGAELFFPYGLDGEIMRDVFPGRPVRMGVIGWAEVEGIYRNLEQKGEKTAASPRPPQRSADTSPWSSPLSRIGRIKASEKPDQIPHAYGPRAKKLLRDCTHEDDPVKRRSKYEQFQKLVTEGPPTNPRAYWLPAFSDSPILGAEEVTSVDRLIAENMFLVPISLGAQPLEAWLNCVIGTEAAGAVAHTGEGGIPEWLIGHRLAPRARQVASGGFSFWARNLADRRCRIITVKMAQAAKPGTGGVLSGSKVVRYVAEIRGTDEGRGAYSPANLLDINSIEDLQWLVRVLRLINPHAAIEVKIVATEDVGPLVFTIADMLNRIGQPLPLRKETVVAGEDEFEPAFRNRLYIQGKGGGTGNSQLASREYSAISWEEGLHDAVQVLAESGLLDEVDLVVDGGCKTAWDVIVAGIMGAKAVGFGTAVMVSDECTKCDVCAGGDCPPGQAASSANGNLIDRYIDNSKVERVVNFWRETATEVQMFLRRAGVRTFAELRGRFDLLKLREFRDGRKTPAGLMELLQRFDNVPNQDVIDDRGIYTTSEIDNAIRKKARQFFESGQGTYNIDVGELQPQYAPIGASIACSLVRLEQSGTSITGGLVVRSHGNAPQGFGMLLYGPVTLIHRGPANNFAFEGISRGAKGVLLQPEGSVSPMARALSLNCVGYRMQRGGTVFVEGTIGSYAASCNRGGDLVAEGCGSYAGFGMSSGRIVILGEAGNRFGAGMTGGSGFVYDPEGRFKNRWDAQAATAERLSEGAAAQGLRQLLEDYHDLTGSAIAATILQNFDREVGNFWVVTCSTPVAVIKGTPATKEHPVVRHVRDGIPLPVLIS